MKKKFLTLLAFVCGLNGMKADEGMWTVSYTHLTLPTT